MVAVSLGTMQNAQDELQLHGFAGFEINQDFDLKKEDIIETLKSFDLNDYESKTYCTLVFLGSSKVSKIAEESSVPQPKVYETLARLVEKNLVEMLDEKPKKYRAVLPQVALNNILEEEEIKLKNLKSKVNFISNYLKPMKDEVVDGVWTQQGEKWTEFFGKVSAMLERCEKYAYVITSNFSCTNQMAKAIKSCKRKGVEIRIISIKDIDDTSVQRYKWFAKNGCKIRIFRTNIHPRIIVVDGKELLIRIDKNSENENKFLFTSVWSKEKSLVNVIDSYMKNLWTNSKTFRLK